MATAVAAAAIVVTASVALYARASTPESERGEGELRERRLTASDLGARWPFTVNSGVVACSREAGVAVITFETGATTYAVNAGARIRGYAQIRRILETRYDEPHGFAAAVAPIIELGHELCGER